MGKIFIFFTLVALSASTLPSDLVQSRRGVRPASTPAATVWGGREDPQDWQPRRQPRRASLQLRGGEQDESPQKGGWQYVSCQDADGDALTLFIFVPSNHPPHRGSIESAGKLLLEIDHEYSDGGFSMCLRPHSASAGNAHLLPPVFSLGNENVLQPNANGLASKEAGRRLWEGRECGQNGTGLEGLPLHTLHEQRLGDWTVAVINATCAPADNSATAASTMFSLQMCNKFFGSKLVFGADGTVVWMSNPFANLCLVLFLCFNLTLLALVLPCTLLAKCMHVISTPEG